MKYSKDNYILFLALKYTKVLAQKNVLLFLVFILQGLNPQITLAFKRTSTNPSNTIDFNGPIVGAQRFSIYLDSLKGKRIAIVGNQTSVVKGTHLVDSLLSLGVKITKVFSPEHGFRGNADAGELVDHSKDTKTGLPIVSLYGTNKKPTNEQMQNIDLVVFDIQDVGVRFYTYLSTLHYVMEACAENKIPLLVLDRPNPNAHYIDGPVLEPEHKSFVGLHPVPIVYGMTIGEYSLMINGENWLKDSLKCNLWVVPCEKYVHKYPYSLPVAPSPNLRTDLSISLYPSLCLFEATTVSVGRGTSRPFEIYGHPNFPKSEFSFTPISCFGAKNPLHENTSCNGFDLNNYYKFRQYQLDLSFILSAKKTLGEENKFINQSQFFNLLAGNSTLQEQINKGFTEEQIRKSWTEKLNKFKKIRKKYLLYA
jgi:uncharacterized protein YbbC (DUF1343 family)